MSLFTLEALMAKHGDSLLLHYGDEDAPRFILIDGGPGKVYQETLRPRLLEIRERWYGKDPLPLEMVMVSHIDDDHINGILDLTDELKKKKDPFCQILCFWHNSFDDVIGNKDEDLFSELQEDVKVASIGGVPPSGQSIKRHNAAVVASVGQGRKLRSNAEALGLRTNDPFSGLVLAETADGTRFDWGDGLRLTVLGPTRERIDELHKEWEKVLIKKGKQAAIAAAYEDDSAFNLSSIVVLAELGGKRMLLTGDARGDHTLTAIEKAGLLKNGKLHVDLLKLPHHGSAHNVDHDYFETIIADHYVGSGDGNYGNPELETLQMISKARPDDRFTLHLTYREGKEDLGPKLKKFLAAEKKKKRKYKVVFREEDARSLKVDLLQPVDY